MTERRAAGAAARAMAGALLAVAVAAGVLPAPAGADHPGGHFNVRIFREHHERYSDVEFNGEMYFAVWEDQRSSSHNDIYGTRITTDGEVLDPGGIAVSTGHYDQEAPKVSWNGETFVVVWSDTRRLGEYGADVYGARVSPGGRVLDPDGFVVAADRHWGSEPPDIAWNGTTHLVAWGRYSHVSEGNMLYVARVTRRGRVLDPGGDVVTYWPDSLTRVASNGSMTLVAGGWPELRVVRLDTGGELVDGVVLSETADCCSAAVATDGAGFLVVWPQEDPDNRFDSDVTAATFHPDGTPSALPPTKISETDDRQEAPDAAWNGSAYQVVWMDGRNGLSQIFGRAVSREGTPLLGSETMMSPEGSELPDVAGGDGGSIVLWPETMVDEDTDLFGALLEADGSPVAGSKFAVSSAGRDVVVHERSIRFRLRWHLVARGRVSAVDGAQGCEVDRAVVIHKRRWRGGWRRIAFERTSVGGRFKTRLPDRRGTYRAVARAFDTPDDLCTRAVSVWRRHRAARRHRR